MTSFDVLTVSSTHETTTAEHGANYMGVHDYRRSRPGTTKTQNTTKRKNNTTETTNTTKKTNNAENEEHGKTNNTARKNGQHGKTNNTDTTTKNEDIEKTKNTEKQ